MRFVRSIALAALVALAVLVMPASSAHALAPGWAWQYPYPQGFEYRDIDWVGTDHGWAVGDAGTIVRTTDGGLTWQSVNTSVGADLVSVDFYDETHGWACGWSGIVLRSTDGGATWSQVGIPVGDSGYNSWSPVRFSAVIALSPVRAWVGGSRGDSFESDGLDFFGQDGVVRETTDGGLTWAARPTALPVHPIEALAASPGGGRVWAVADNTMSFEWTPGRATGSYLAPFGPRDTDSGNRISGVTAFPDGSGWGVAGGSLFFTPNANGEWFSPVRSQAITDLAGVSDASFASPSEGVLVGSTGALWTIDGGATWNRSASLWSDYSGDPRMGAVARGTGGAMAATGAYARLFTSVDGGRTFEDRTWGTARELFGALCAVDDTYAWAMGFYGVWRTADGGRQWRKVAGTVPRPTAIAAVSASIAWVGTEDGLYKTVDAGETWTLQPSLGNRRATEIAATDGQHAWAKTVDPGVAPGPLYRTTDGGSTWTALAQSTSDLSSLCFVDASYGWAVGGDGQVRRTTDGGSTWGMQSTALYEGTLRLSSVSFLDRSEGWAVGEGLSSGGFTALGAALHTIDGGQTWQDLMDSQFAWIPWDWRFHEIRAAGPGAAWTSATRRVRTGLDRARRDGEVPHVLQLVDAGMTATDEVGVPNRGLAPVAAATGWACGLQGIVAFGRPAGEAPPATRLTRDPAVEWSNRDVRVTLTAAAREGTGTASARYRFAAGGETDYSAPITVGTEGVTDIEYWSVSGSGLVGDKASTSIKVDKTPPQTALPGLTGSGSFDLIAGDPRPAAALVPTDPGPPVLIEVSGLADTVWSLDGGTEHHGTRVSATGDGLHTLRFHSVDMAGNVEAERTATFTIDPRGVVVPERLWGTTRYETALEISRRLYTGPPGGGLALATGADYPDALCAAPLAAAVGGPLLLVPPSGLTSALRAEIERLAPTSVYIIGKTGAVSQRVEDEVRAMVLGDGTPPPGPAPPPLPTGERTIAALLARPLSYSPRVTRLGGEDRYETSVRVSEALDELTGGSTPRRMVLATGLSFPDALSIAPAAALNRWPILLTRRLTLPISVAERVRTGDFASSIVVGSSGVVSDPIVHGLPSPTRLGGADRYETCALVADFAADNGCGWTTLMVATGAKFPDALAAGPAVASRRGMLVITRPAALPEMVSARITEHASAVRSAYIAGGIGAVSADCAGQLARLLQ